MVRFAQNDLELFLVGESTKVKDPPVEIESVRLEKKGIKP